jgi:hypothetical protein
MEVLVSGSIDLNGTDRRNVTIPDITANHKIFIKIVSSAMKGMLVVSEITPGEGFGLSSSSPDDVGMIVYFNVYSE